MKFSEIIAAARALLEQNGRVSRRALKREFDLDDATLADLAEELVAVLRVADLEDGQVLVARTKTASPSGASSPAPIDYTPAHLSERIRAEQVVLEGRGDGERKTITALFADLKGSTALIEDLDPEQARALIDPALALMMEAVHHYEGYVAQALGDGIFALFGAPIAQEDHAQRAVHAALRLREALRAHGEKLRRDGRAPLQVRVGLNSGEVVVRSIRKSDLRTDYVPIGHSTNLAARMEQLAAPDSVLVTERTYDLARGYFDFRALGAVDVKGVAEPIEIFEVLGAKARRTRLEVAAERGLTRFVGRDLERAQLLRALAESRAGQGQIVAVVGEPGLGKSRLFHEFKRELTDDCRVLEARPVSHGRGVAYLTVLDLLRDCFGLSIGDDEETKRAKLDARLAQLEDGIGDALPFLRNLFDGGDLPSGLAQLEAQVRRQRTLDAVRRVLLHEAGLRPLVVIVEDLHWLDGESQALLDLLAESIGAAQLLILVNYRPEYQHAWSSKTYYTQVRLAPLVGKDAHALLDDLLGSDVALNAIKAKILARTEGTPFFIEEVVQNLVEQGALRGERGRYELAESAPGIEVPPTVQSVLAARIDRLPDAQKTLLQQLAVIGRAFSLPLVLAIVGMEESGLAEHLAALRAREFVYEQHDGATTIYRFKHALTQDVGYAGVLHEVRHVLHARIASAIERLYALTLDAHYAELAHHYDLAGDQCKAIEYLYLAGQQAVNRAAFADAVPLLERALARIETDEDTSALAPRELSVQAALGAAYIVTKGYGDAAVGRAYARTRELCHRLEDRDRLIPTLGGLWLSHTIRAEHAAARDLSHEILNLAKADDDRAQWVVGHYALGQNEMLLGQYARSVATLDRVLELYDPDMHDRFTAAIGEDPAVVAFAFKSNVLWLLGYPDEALRCADRAVALANTLGDAFSLAQARMFLVIALYLRGEGASVDCEAERKFVRDFVFYSAFGEILLRALAYERQPSAAALGDLREALGAYRATDSRIALPWFLAMLARAEATAGNRELAMACLEEAADLQIRSQEDWNVLEIPITRGRLWLEWPDLAGSERDRRAEASFEEALEVARAQGARSFELLAATALARLWGAQGRKADAQALLAPIYAQFTEGFDTAPLRDARILLDALTGDQEIMRMG